MTQTTEAMFRAGMNFRREDIIYHSVALWTRLIRRLQLTCSGFESIFFFSLSMVNIDSTDESQISNDVAEGFYFFDSPKRLIAATHCVVHIGKRKRKVGGVRYETLSRRRSSPDSLVF